MHILFFIKEAHSVDASGARTITSSGTSLTVYAFGLEEHVYNGSGSNVSNTSYYMLGGCLIGKCDGTNTQYYLTDAQGSVLTTFSNAATTTSVSGYQAYGPYGNKLASSGSMGTAKGFTGQYQDPTRLDYYNARYYDPVIGCFISADTVQGNAQGMDPYSYVNGNPETLTDPTGQTVSHCHEPGDCGPDSGWVDPPASSSGGSGATGPVQSICIYSCYVGSGGSNGSGGCTSSCDDGAYRLPPQLNSSRPTSGGNPKIVTSTTKTTATPTPPTCSASCNAKLRQAIQDKANAATIVTNIAGAIQTGILIAVDLALKGTLGLLFKIADFITGVLLPLGQSALLLWNILYHTSPPDWLKAIVTAITILSFVASAFKLATAFLAFFDVGYFVRSFSPVKKLLGAFATGILGFFGSAASGIGLSAGYQLDTLDHMSSEDEYQKCIGVLGESACK